MLSGDGMSMYNVCSGNIVWNVNLHFALYRPRNA